MKTCTKCGQDKPLYEFPLTGNKRKPGSLRSQCKECKRNQLKEYRNNNPEKVRSIQDRYRPKKRQASKDRYKSLSEAEKRKSLDIGRAHALMRKYNISINRWDEMMKVQKSLCASCRDKFGESRLDRPAVHHNHFTGHVEGIWHIGCNLAEGSLRTVKRARALAESMDRESLFNYLSNRA